MDEFILRDNNLFILYYNKRKFILYVWNLKDPLAKAEVYNFSGLFNNCRFLSTDYLIMDDKQNYYFFSLQQKNFDRFARDEGLIRRNPEPSVILKFSLILEDKFSLIFDLENFKFFVLSFSKLDRIFYSNKFFAVNENNTLMGCFKEKEVVIIDISKNCIISKIPFVYNHSFKNIRIMSDELICFVFSKKLKVFSVMHDRFI